MRFRRLLCSAALGLLSGCYDFFGTLVFSGLDAGVEPDAGPYCPDGGPDSPRTAIKPRGWTFADQAGSSVLLWVDGGLIAVDRNRSGYDVSNSLGEPPSMSVPHVGEVPLPLPSDFKPTAGLSSGTLQVIGSSDGRVVHGLSSITASTTWLPRSRTATSEPVWIQALAVTSSTDPNFAVYALGQTQWEDVFYRADMSFRFTAIATVSYRGRAGFDRPPQIHNAFGALLVRRKDQGVLALSRDSECLTSKAWPAKCVIQLWAPGMPDPSDLPLAGITVPTSTASAAVPDEANTDEATVLAELPNLGVVVGTGFGAVLPMLGSAKIGSLAELLPSDKPFSQGTNVRAIYPIEYGGMFVASDRAAAVWYPEIKWCQGYAKFGSATGSGTNLSSAFIKATAAVGGGWALVGDPDSQGEGLFTFTLVPRD
jgi:hypothetical protein